MENNQQELKKFLESLFGVANKTGDKDSNNIFNKYYNDLDLKNKEYCKCNDSKENVFSENSTYSGYKTEKIYKDENYIGIKLLFAVPGVSKGDLFVSSKGNIICVKSKTDAFFFGKLDTKIRIKFDFNVNNISSHYENGLLTISVLKDKFEDNQNIVNID